MQQLPPFSSQSVPLQGVARLRGRVAHWRGPAAPLFGLLALLLALGAWPGVLHAAAPAAVTPGWLDVLKRNAASNIFLPEKQFDKSTSWAQLRQRAEGKSQRELLRLVNAFWNKWPYREDQVNWGKPDYWATPAQFLQKSGDCEDYAIVKYFTLKELGIDANNMRIVVLRDTIRNLAHAVLVVYLNGEAYVLDNLSNVVQPHTRFRNYSPQYSVNENGRWAHIKGRPAAGGPRRGAQ